MMRGEERYLHEECGVFGVCSQKRQDVASLTYYGLFALQHRGQESAGIVVNDEGVFTSCCDVGLVSEVFPPQRLHSLGEGNIAVGHVRYATTGSDHKRNVQPIVINHFKGRMALAHNGNLTNSMPLRHELEERGSIFHTTTDSEVIAYEIVHGGFLHIVAQEGETVKVGAPIAYVTDTKEQYDQLVSGGAPAAAAEPEEKGCARNCPTCVHSSTVPDAAPVKDRISASGLAKKMAKEAGIDLAAVAPTGGPNGRRIVAKDIEAYLKNAKPAEAVSAAPAAASDADEVTAIPWVGVRKTIARNMFNSMQQMAQSTCVCEVDATELLALRAELVADQDMLGCKITVNDLLCKMLGKVLPRHPLANATFDGKMLYDLAVHAAELGIEMLVMDDGWFGKRNDDNSSLGDWVVNEEKLGEPLKDFIEKINGLGMKFGIWF